MRSRTRARLHVRSALLLAFAMAEPLGSQSSSSIPVPDTVSQTQRSCFRGRPLPRCESFWLTEFGIAAPVTRAARGRSDRLYTLELGGMKNVNDRLALGAAAFAEARSSISGIGVRPRLRFWLTENNSLELSPGVVMAGSGTGLAFSGHAALNVSDHFALTVHFVDVRRQTPSDASNYPFVVTGRPTHAQLYAGGRLGAKLGVGTGILYALMFSSAASLFYHEGTD